MNNMYEKARRIGTRWVDNIKMDLLDTGWVGVDWLRIGTGEGLL
jgi:hypothetical protein